MHHTRQWTGSRHCQTEKKSSNFTFSFYPASAENCSKFSSADVKSIINRRDFFAETFLSPSPENRSDITRFLIHRLFCRCVFCTTFCLVFFCSPILRGFFSRMFVFSGKSGFCLSLIRELTRALNVEWTSTLSVKFRDFSCDHFTPLIKQFARTKNNLLSATQKILFKIISNIFHVNFCVDSRHWRENKSRFAKPRLSACNSNEYWLKTEQFLLFLFPLSNRPPFFLQHVQREAMENAVRVSIATRLIQLQTRCAIVQSAVGWSWPRARLYWLACTTTGSSRVKGVTHLRRAEGRWCLWDVPGALSVKHENDFLWAERRVMYSSTQEGWWCWWWKKKKCCGKYEMNHKMRNCSHQ